MTCELKRYKIPKVNTNVDSRDYICLHVNTQTNNQIPRNVFMVYLNFVYMMREVYVIKQTHLKF